MFPVTVGSQLYFWFTLNTTPFLNTTPLYQNFLYLFATLLPTCFGLRSAIVREITYHIANYCWQHLPLQQDYMSVPPSRRRDPHTLTFPKPWILSSSTAVKIPNPDSVLCLWPTSRVRTTNGFNLQHADKTRWLFPSKDFIPWRFVFLATRRTEKIPTKCHVQSVQCFGNAPNSAAYGNTKKKGKV
jgi:hypothetical protein